MLSVPGGKLEHDQPWSAFPPDACCEKLTLLLKFLVEPDGTHPNVDPFVIPSLENAANKTVFQEVYNAWLKQASITTDTVKTFYDLVVTGDHKLPYITTMGGKPASWFIQSMLTPHSWVSIKTVQNSSGEELVAKALFEEGDFKKWLVRQRRSPFPMVCVEPYTMRYPQCKDTVDMLIRLGQMPIPTDLRDKFLKSIISEIQKMTPQSVVASPDGNFRAFIS